MPAHSGVSYAKAWYVNVETHLVKPGEHGAEFWSSVLAKLADAHLRVADLMLARGF